jgi:hypothetical protein
MIVTERCPFHGRAYKQACETCWHIVKSWADWQNDRTYLSSEQVLDQRLDRCS